MDREARDEAARDQDRQIQGFYANLGAYSAVNLGLFTIDLATSGGPWFYWPLLGWGVGVVAHGVNVFGAAGVAKLRATRPVRRVTEQQVR